MTTPSNPPTCRAWWGSGHPHTCHRPHGHDHPHACPCGEQCHETSVNEGPLPCPMCSTATTTPRDHWCDNHQNPHATCRQNAAAAAADYRRGLMDARDQAAANQRIAWAIRALTQPGIKNKTLRISEIRAIIDRADKLDPARTGQP